MRTLAQGCASCRFPGNHAVQPGAVQRARACAIQCLADADKRKTALDLWRIRVEPTKNVFLRVKLERCPHCLRIVDTDRQTRLFSCLAVRPLKTRYADPLECRTQGRAGQGGRSNAHQSAGSNADGSNGAEWIEQCIKCIVLVLAFLDLAVSQPRKPVDAQPGFAVGGDIST